MKFLYVAILLGILSGCASSGDAYSSRWAQLSAEHRRLVATAEGSAWQQAFLPVHNAFWRDVYSSCIGKAKNSGVAYFRALAVIDGTGTVTEVLAKPNSNHFSCFSKQMVGRKYPAPPVAPFYEVFLIMLEPK